MEGLEFETDGIWNVVTRKRGRVDNSIVIDGPILGKLGT